MWDFIEKIWIYLPYSVKIMMLIILVVIFIFIGFKYGIETLSSFVKYIKEKGKSTNYTDLKNHLLFTNISTLLSFKIKTTNFGDVGRNKIFNTIIEARVVIIEKYSRKLLEIIQDLNDDNFKTTVINCLNNSNIEFDNKLKEKFTKDSYDLIITHPNKGFNRWHSQIQELTFGFVISICESDIYDKYTKMELVFDSINMSINLMASDMEKTYKGFNGEIDYLLDNDLIFTR